MLQRGSEVPGDGRRNRNFHPFEELTNIKLLLCRVNYYDWFGVQCSINISFYLIESSYPQCSGNDCYPILQRRRLRLSGVVLRDLPKDLRPKFFSFHVPLPPRPIASGMAC